jgi:hypothetical protein
MSRGLRPPVRLWRRNTSGRSPPDGFISPTSRPTTPSGRATHGSLVTISNSPKPKRRTSDRSGPPWRARSHSPAPLLAAAHDAPARRRTGPVSSPSDQLRTRLDDRQCRDHVRYGGAERPDGRASGGILLLARPERALSARACPHATRPEDARSYPRRSSSCSPSDIRAAFAHRTANE